jgi:hypothetical protein
MKGIVRPMRLVVEFAKNVVRDRLLLQRGDREARRDAAEERSDDDEPLSDGFALKRDGSRNSADEACGPVCRTTPATFSHRRICSAAAKASTAKCD